MKKMIVAVLLFTAFSTGTQAQNDTTRKTFYFYPEVNVYYNPATMDYYYYDSTATRWNTGKDLPKHYNIGAKDKYETIYYNGTDVWLSNPDHRKPQGKPVPAPPER